MKRLFFLIALPSLLYSCETLEKTQEDNCPPQACTMEYRAVSVRFVDEEGKPLEVKNYTSINRRTKTSMLKGVVPDTVTADGWALVASDANLHDISEAGDTIVVTAFHPVNGNKTESLFVITGGKCACHINKVSGPEQVVIK